MADWRETQELVEMDGRIKVPYVWSAGETGTRYLNALSEEKKFHLAGADTYILHFIDETDPEKVRVGDRVKAVFSGRRQADGQPARHKALRDKEWGEVSKTFEVAVTLKSPWIAEAHGFRE